MQVSPAVCLGFLLRVSLLELSELRLALIFPSRACKLGILTCSGIQKHGISFYDSGMLKFFLNPFLEFSLSTLFLSSIILLHMSVHTFDTLKIPEHCFGTEDTLKR